MSLSTFCRFAREQQHPESHERCTGIRCVCDCHQEEYTPMTAVDCPHCDATCAGPQGLASHIRSMHPAEYRVAVAAREAPPGPATPASAPDSNGLVWEDPPPKSRGGAQLNEVLALLPQLRRNPGRWARLYTFTTKSGANALQTKTRKAVSDIELVARSDSKAGTSALYGRYVEPDE